MFQKTIIRIVVLKVYYNKVSEDVWLRILDHLKKKRRMHDVLIDNLKLVLTHNDLNKLDIKEIIGNTRGLMVSAENERDELLAVKIRYEKDKSLAMCKRLEKTQNSIQKYAIYDKNTRRI